MIRRNLRRLAARIRVEPSGSPSDHRAFVRLAYLLAFKREPEEADYRRHEGELLAGRSRTDFLRELLSKTEAPMDRDGSPAEIPASHVGPEDADTLVRLAFRSLLRRDAGDLEAQAYREAFERGTTILDLINDIARSDEFNVTGRVRPEDADGLIELGFRKLLRRDPDPDAYVSYREGFERGTTFLDLINDIARSEEYQIIEEKIEHLLAAPPPVSAPAPAHPIASDMDAALTLLEARLGEKGCTIQLGAVPAGAADGASAQRRMRSLLVTLSLVDRL